MGKTRPSEPSITQYFAAPAQPLHRQYVALRSFLYDGNTAEAVAAEYGYTVSTVYTLARNFKAKLRTYSEQGEDPFFQTLKPGKKNSIAMMN